MDHRYKVGGYVKLAKLWERSKDAAVAYHSSYYAEKFRDDADKRLVGVYIPNCMAIISSISKSLFNIRSILLREIEMSFE